MKALIIGKSGQLAQELLHVVPTGWSAVAMGRESLDLNSAEAIHLVLDQVKPQVVINASAYTAVDKAETDQDAAFALNHHAVELLAKACQMRALAFIQVSTDFVFDGTSNRAYLPTDKTSPLGVYGESKLKGEAAVAAYCADYGTVIRTSWVYSVYGNNFVKTMLRLMSERPSLSVVSDQIGAPTYAADLADFIWRLVQTEQREPIYHWSDSGVASWYDFAVAIQEEAVSMGLLTQSVPVSPIPSSAYPTPARRPAFSLLNTLGSTHIKDSVHWRKNLRLMLALLKARQG